MPEPNPPRPFKVTSTALILSAMLAAQLGLYASFSKTEKVPIGEKLELFPNELGRWVKTQEGFVDEATQAVLQADDTLTRSYADHQARVGASLFIASFRSQRTGVAPHSPKNCLPGNGWTPTVDDRIQVSIPGRAEPIEVNRYVIQRGDAKSLVLYWFQNRDRAVASEVKAKFYTMRDAVLENRTDTALVRVIIPLQDGEDERMQAAAEDFIRSFYRPLLRFLPA
jgi:EpsI family protein